VLVHNCGDDDTFHGNSLQSTRPASHAGS
jgi:hypothetical protein